MREIWSLLELFTGWLLRGRSKAIPRGQLWSVLTELMKKKRKKEVHVVKSKNKNNWITSYACWWPVIKTLHEFLNERSASGEDMQRRKEKEESSIFLQKGEIILTDSTQEELLVCTLTSREKKERSKTELQWKTWATCCHWEKEGQTWGPKGAISAARITLNRLRGTMVHWVNWRQL